MDATYTGMKIAESRKAKGWTQKELAQQLHVTDKAVSKWERGVNFPDLSLMESITKLLDISLEELLGIENYTPKETIQVITGLCTEEKQQLERTFRKQTWDMIRCGCLLLISQVAAYLLFTLMPSKVNPFITHMLTLGMTSITIIIIRNAIFSLRHYKEL